MVRAEGGGRRATSHLTTVGLSLATEGYSLDGRGAAMAVKCRHLAVVVWPTRWRLSKTEKNKNKKQLKVVSAFCVLHVL